MPPHEGFRLFILFYLSVMIWKLTDGQQHIEYYGCFVDNLDMRELPSKILDSQAHISADQCAVACARQYFMYAGLQAGTSCFCGSSYGKYGPGNCTFMCEGNRTQPCGGVNANSVYGTGFMVPGPPQNVTLTTAKQTSLRVRWTPPVAKNGRIRQYKVASRRVQSLIDTPVVTEATRNWVFSNVTFEEELAGLTPASQYNISVWATSEAGEGVPFSAVFWTDFDEPDKPQMAEIIKQDSSQMTIRIPEVTATKGPISAYQVIVYDESQNLPFDSNHLTNVKEAKLNQWPFYIAAELSPPQIISYFVVGDGNSYGGYGNPPLSTNGIYTVIIGAVSRLNGLTKASYSEPATLRTAKLDKDNKDLHNLENSRADVIDSASGHFVDSHDTRGSIPEEHVYEDASLVTGLGVAVGIASVLLVASIIVYFMIRYHYGQRQQPDHQELTLQPPSPEVSENGIASSILVMDDEGDPEFLFDSLKDKFWQIPRPSLEITDEILGQGKYGAIYKGIAHRRNQQFSVAVQVSQPLIPNIERERRNFINDLDALIHIGSHTNVVGLIGGCEERDLYHVCTEWYAGSLKDFLLDSRTMDHYPIYAEKQHRMSTAKELQLLEMALGVARGMAHLANNKILHKRLTARNVSVVDEVTAKVTGFGFTQAESIPGYDVTRWLPMETLKSRLFTSKSDVWMFGVVLWEIVTLGGTPYAPVKTKEVSGRVLRGSRLPQPKYVGDDLYQIMLQCWQVDLDERPSCQELTSILGTMVTEGNNMEHFHLELYPGFQYEKYEKELELMPTIQ